MIKCPDQEDVKETKTQVMKIVEHYKPRKFGVNYLKPKLEDVSREIIIEALEALVDDRKISQREFGLSDEPLYHVRRR